MEDIIRETILIWIGNNYGSQEMEDPCYDIDTLAKVLADVLQSKED